MRIEAIANLINNANIVVDVGSDHAKLSTILVSNNKANTVYNIEKNEKPYLNSVNNTKKFKNIINIKSDGFKEFDKSINIDYCTISGMGALTMIDILCKTPNKISNIILCPNNNEHLIRLFAHNNFYKIKKDFIISDNHILYSIIWLSKDEGIKASKKSKNLYCGNFKFKKEDPFYKEFLMNKISLFENIDNLKKKNKSKFKELQIYKKELRKLEKKKN